MNKVILILLVIYLVSCSTTKNYEEFYKRQPNKETELFNEYLTPFFKATQPSDRTTNVYLRDSLKPVSERFGRSIELNLSLFKDSSFIEALLDLSNFSRKAKPICFSQLNKIEHIKIIPLKVGDEIDFDYDNWEYSFSLPGFNKDSTKMCYTYSYYCGSLCAIFSLILMEKKDGKWVFVKEQVIMQS